MKRTIFTLALLFASAFIVNAQKVKEKDIIGTWKLVIEDIEDDDDNFNISTDDDEWKLIDGILVSDEHEEDRTVYMTRVD